MSSMQPSDDRPTLLGESPEQITERLLMSGEQPFRGRQIAAWLYQRRVADFAAMTDLGVELRQKLAGQFRLLSAQVTAAQSIEDTTTKFALRFPDGVIVESVLMIEPEANDDERITVCLSTQAGCAMGCAFCASGKLGLRRNLSVAEILEQVYALVPHLPEGRWISNVVFMGMGEPLHNWDGTVGAIRVLTAPWGFGLSPRRITVSTVGIPQRIRALADLDIPVHLALSLHAPSDSIRRRIIPTNDVYGGLTAIMDAAAYYQRTTRRQVTFEYTLVADLNDSAMDAENLALLVTRVLPGANINLIPMNPVQGSGLQSPTGDRVERFSRILRSRGLNVHTRKRKGRSINAACGQLRLGLEQTNEQPQ